MGLRDAWRRLAAWLSPPHGPVLGFEQEVEAAGIAGRADAGMATIPTRKVVGSVGRAHDLRSDFFHRTGRAVTARYVSIGRAMERGVALPPIEVYKARQTRRRGEVEAVVTEYYVVDGHHRVAMARKLGQDYLDAHVVEYRLKPSDPQGAPDPPIRRAEERLS
jgi:hypothetical protein